jgi:flagellar M-ring protein FliF
MDFKTLLNQIASLFQSLSMRQRIVAAGSIAVVVGFLVFLSFYKGGQSKSFDGYSVLFENTTPADSALIIQQLEKDGVPYKVYNEGTLMVPSNVVYKERIAIAALGIPKNSKVGFEIFDKQEFGATDFEQRIKYLRALEGELARTIEGLMPINDANVHIAIPKETVFTERQSAPTASIVLSIRPNMHLKLKQITGIKNLVAASVTNMSPENVKVVNQNGVPLGDEEGAYENEMVQNQIKYKRDFESNYEQKIINVLAPVIGGVDKVVAKVTIDFDFAREDSVSEVYDPNSVPRSEQAVEEKRKGTKPEEVGGVPGAVSNIGPVEGLESQKSTDEYSKSSTTTNYEISKKVTNVKDEFATIKRLTAAVVVDGKYVFKKNEAGEDTGELEFIPLSKEQLDSISAVVRQAVGYSQVRGDEVTVSNFEFKPLSKDGIAPPTETWVRTVSVYLAPVLPLLKYLLVGIILFVFYKKVIAPFSERMISVGHEDIEIPLEEEVEEESAEDTLEKFRQARKKVEEQLGIGEDFNEDEMRYDVLLEKLKSVANDRSEEIAGLLQNMIKSESDFSTRNKE